MVALRELVVHNGACDHVGLLLEVKLAVAKLLLVIDERRQRERLLLVVFVRGFQVRNMDSSLATPVNVVACDGSSDPSLWLLLLIDLCVVA